MSDKVEIVSQLIVRDGTGNATCTKADIDKLHTIPAEGVVGPQGPQGLRSGVTYTFSTTTTDADPGNGVFRYNSATIASVTFIYIDNVDAGGITQTAWYDKFDDSTNATNKGFLTIQSSSSTGTALNIFSVTGAVTAATGYYKIPVSYVSGALPTNNTQMVIGFVRNGDTGATGAAGSTTAAGTSVTTTNLTHALTSADDTVQKALDTLDDRGIRVLQVANIALATELEAIAGPATYSTASERSRIIRCIQFVEVTAYDKHNDFIFDPTASNTRNAPYRYPAAGGVGAWVANGPLYTANDIVSGSWITASGTLHGNYVRTATHYAMINKAGAAYLDIIQRETTNNEAQAKLKYIQSVELQSPDLSKTLSMSIDNTGTIQGLQHRASLQFSLANSGNIAPGYCYLKAGEVVCANNLGIVMERAGSIVGYGLIYTTTGTPGATYGFNIVVNSTAVWPIGGGSTGTNAKMQNTQAANTDRFAAGDVIWVSGGNDGTGSFSFTNVICRVDVLFDN